MPHSREGCRGPSTLRILGLRRSPSPLGLLVVQRRARLAKQMAATVMYGVGHIGAETHRVHKIVEATTAEARPVRDKVQSCVASLAVLADASALRAAEEIAGRVKEVAAYSDAQASRVTVEVTQ